MTINCILLVREGKYESGSEALMEQNVKFQFNNARISQG